MNQTVSTLSVDKRNDSCHADDFQGWITPRYIGRLLLEVDLKSGSILIVVRMFVFCLTPFYQPEYTKEEVLNGHLKKE